MARRGYRVTAVDLSAGLIDVCRKRLIEAGLDGQVRLVVADARDLGEVTEREFDAALLMGPLYHLIVEADRKTALKEAVDRLREGGLLFSAFLSRFGVLADLLRNNPGWIEDQAHVQSFVTKGKRPDDFPRGGFRAYSAHVSEIVPLHEAMGLETVFVSGVEPAISSDDAVYNRLEGRQRQLWLDLLYTISSDPSIMGASRHVLYVGRKK
jgi:S-adenosylmethionine-dependent methyltransferase